MNISREQVASTVLGSVAAFILLYTLIGLERPAAYVVAFAIGATFEGFSLAIAPQILFEKVTLAQLSQSRGPVGYGLAALFSVVAKVCAGLAAVTWLLSNFTH